MAVASGRISYDNDRLLAKTYTASGDDNGDKSVIEVDSDDETEELIFGGDMKQLPPPLRPLSVCSRESTM